MPWQDFLNFQYSPGEIVNLTAFFQTLKYGHFIPITK
jgi:hypothetical protein